MPKIKFARDPITEILVRGLSPDKQARIRASRGDTAKINSTKRLFIANMTRTAGVSFNPLNWDKQDAEKVLDEWWIQNPKEFNKFHDKHKGNGRKMLAAWTTGNTLGFGAAIRKALILG